MKRFGYFLAITMFALTLSGCGTPEQKREATDSEWTEPATDQLENPKQTAESEQETEATSWEFDGEKWQSFTTPPACPEPLVMRSPVDMSLVSGILYPGQYRGGNYKPHGGFRFDGKKSSDVTVTAPFDATLTIGSRYIEQGEVQYLLYFEHSCGLAYRFDHLLTLAPVIQKVADALPAAKPDDSRTTRFTTPIQVKAGDIIATAVGFTKTQNVSMDWGVYDLRQPNVASKNPAFAAKHADDKSQAFYGVCWFDLLPSDLAQKVRTFPASGSEGKTSDYCQ